MDVDQLKEVVVSFENVWIALFADFALKLFPVVTRYIFTVLFHVPLCFYPVFETLKVDQTDRTSTLTSEDKRIVVVFFWPPTESTVDLLLS